MKKLIAGALLAAVVTTGCVLSKKQTVTPNGTGGFTTNVVTTVNELNLALWTGGTRLAAAGLTAEFKKDPVAVKALTDAHIALDGILHGANTNTTANVVEMLKSTGNPQLTMETTSFMNSVSKIEQGLLEKYGTTVAGEISVAFTQAISDGIALGLNL